MDTNYILYTLGGLNIALLVILVGGFIYLYKSISGVERQQRLLLLETGKKAKETIERLDRKLAEALAHTENQFGTLKENLDRAASKNYQSITGGVKDLSKIQENLMKSSEQHKSDTSKEISELHQTVVESFAKQKTNLGDLQALLQELQSQTHALMVDTSESSSQSLGEISSLIEDINRKAQQLLTLESIELEEK